MFQRIMAAAAGACLLAGGCATISGDDTQTIRIETVDRQGRGVEGAHCKVANEKGSWQLKSPGLVEVRRSGEELMIDCTAAGHQPGRATAVSRANGAIAGNLILGGIAGAIVDSSTGAGFDYPEVVRVVFGAQQVVDPHDQAGRLSDPLPAPSSPASGNPSGGPLPQAGASWTYRVRDQQFRRDQRFTVQVASVQNLVVTESIDADGTSLPGIVDARRLRFVERRVAGRPIVELSPYLLNSGQGPSAGVGDAPADYPTGSAPERFRVRVVKAERERVVVPAGAFNALKVEVAGEREGVGGHGYDRNWNHLLVARFRYTAWYAPETGRYIMARHQQWNPSGAPTMDDLIQLLEYRAK